MMETSTAIESNPNDIQYSFRFLSSNQLLHLTQQQLNRIPYLSALIAHKDNFLSIQNENGEYLLNDPLQYSSVVAILRSIDSNNPYILLDQLPKDGNVLNTLDLVDYLGLQSFPLPILKDVNLVRSNPDQNENEKVEYRRATLSEARQIAAEFVVGIAKNEYQLDDPNTANNIFNLMNIILSNSSVFSSSFRCHSFTIVRDCCYSFFSKDQKHQLHVTHRTILFNRRNPSTYLSGENNAIPINFDNAFTWKSVPVTSDDNHADSLSSDFNEGLDSNNFETLNWFDNAIWLNEMHEDTSIYNLFFTSIRMSLRNTRLRLQREIARLEEMRPNQARLEEMRQDRARIEEMKQDRRKKEAQSARSGHFNTIPKRPKVDRFKHRCGPKAQKHR